MTVTVTVTVTVCVTVTCPMSHFVDKMCHVYTLIEIFFFFVL